MDLNASVEDTAPSNRQDRIDVAGNHIDDVASKTSSVSRVGDGVASTGSLARGSSSSSDHGGDCESVRSNHAGDYYEHREGCKADGFINAGDSEASSVSSLHSCEVIAACVHGESVRPDQDSCAEYEYQSRYSQSVATADHEADGDDESTLGFPPGHITRLDQLNELQNNSGLRDSIRSVDEDRKSFVNPSIIPSYFFCPLTSMIMRDPVITPDGHTFERRAILRSLILEPVDPISKNPLLHDELADDYLVSGAIDKARKEAWIRYSVEFEAGEDCVGRKIEWIRGCGGNALTKIGEEGRGARGVESPFSNRGDRAQLLSFKKHMPPLLQSPLSELGTLKRGTTISNPTLGWYDNGNSIVSPESVDTTGFENHGWSVPLGVHRIICSPPGLIVTTDVHRRSTVVKRKVIKKNLFEDGGERKSNTVKTINLKRRKLKKKHGKDFRITTSVVAHDMVLAPGSHVEILETRVHGGRVRGRIIWEEEVLTEVDHKLAILLEEEEVRKRAMARPKKPSSLGGHSKVLGIPKAPRKTKPKLLFRRKSSTVGTSGDEWDNMLSSPFGSEMLDSQPLNLSSVGELSLSPSPLATVKYRGWISLQWSGSVNNYERDEALRYSRSLGDGQKVTLVADEDEGPWVQPLPLGVYRIAGDANEIRSGLSASQIPLYDAPDSESNIIDFLACNQCLEIVETQVLVMRRKDRDCLVGSDLPGIAEGRRMVRARCMVPVAVSQSSSENADVGDEPISTSPRRKFLSGWITLSEDLNKGISSAAAYPVPVGAYIVTTNDPLLSCDTNSRIKCILPSGSCMEVDATRIEFEEKEKMMKCHSCGREGMYHSVAVRALIATGGYVTLSIVSVGMPGTHGSLCACGQLVQQTYAEPVPVGIYRMKRPARLTRGLGNRTQVIMQLMENTSVQVVETRVEDGCVRGRVNIVVANGNNDVGQEDDMCRRKESLTGWVSLFKPPSFRWAELISHAT